MCMHVMYIIFTIHMNNIAAYMHYQQAVNFKISYTKLENLHKTHDFRCSIEKYWPRDVPQKFIAIGLNNKALITRLMLYGQKNTRLSKKRNKKLLTVTSLVIGFF